MLPKLRLPNGKLPPVYCTQLTHGLVQVKLQEHKLASKADLKIVRPGEKIKAGRFSVEFVHMTHSIPDSAALAIQTPMGLIFHTGDFKIDHTPVMGDPPTSLGLPSWDGRASCCSFRTRRMRTHPDTHPPR